MNQAKSCKVFLTTCMVVVTVTVVVGFGPGGCGGVGNSSGNPGGSGPPNPVPSVAALNPASVASGGPDFYLTVYGTGFSPSSVVQWNGLKLQTTFVSSTQVFGVAPGGYRSASSTASVTVLNPPPGGGTSNLMSVLVGPVTSPPQGVGVIQLVSMATDGTAGNGATYTAPAISSDGRYVAFQSDSTNLVPGPASGFTDIYVRYTCLGAPTTCAPTTSRVSVANDGSLPNGNSRSPAISADGRYVAFDSSATNFFPGSKQANGAADVFVRDTCIGAPTGCVPTTTLVSVANDGTQANDDSRGAAITADGRFIAFSSSATNLVPNDTNGWSDIFVRDTCSGATTGCTSGTTRVSVASDGTQSTAPSGYAGISANGRYISFRLAGTNNLVPNNPSASVILHDTCFGASNPCTPANRSLFAGYAGDAVNGTVNNLWVLSPNGRFSGFGAEATNLVPGDTGQMVGAFVYDDCIGASASCFAHTDRVSVTYNGGPANNGSGAAVSSNDGNYIVFISIADNLLSYAYRSSAVYVRMTCANVPAGCIPTTYLLSFDRNTGIQGNSSYSDYPAITPDGLYGVFISDAANWPGALQSNGKNQVWLARVQ